MSYRGPDGVPVCHFCSGGVSGGAIVTGYSAETIAEGTGFVNQLFRLRLDYDPGVPDLPSTIIVKLPGSE